MVSTIVTHPYKRTVNELSLKKASMIKRLFKIFIYDIIFANCIDYATPRI